MSLAPILVVDDESEMRTALSHALDRGGFSVESAASGTEALIKLKKDAFSMVITDIKMPEMSGIEVLGAVKKLSPQIPVIMITAYGSIHNAVEAMQAGAADYLLKPFSFETLETTVKKVLESQDVNGNSRSSKQNATIQSNTKTLVTQDPKLLDGCGTVNICCNQEWAVPSFFIDTCQLARSCCLSRSLQTGQHDHGGGCGWETDLAVRGPHQIRELLLDNLDELLTRLDSLQHFLSGRLLLDAGKEVLYDLKRDVRLEQRHADLSQSLVDVGFGDLLLQADLVADIGEAARDGLKHGRSPMDFSYWAAGCKIGG
jgi:DNA-binding response OmpR family regulator